MNDHREEEYDYEQDRPESESMGLEWVGNAEDYDDGGFSDWEDCIVRRTIG